MAFHRIASVGLDPRFFGTHLLRRTKATDVSAIQLFLGHKKMESIVCCLGIKVDDAPAMAELVDI